MKKSGVLVVLTIVLSVLLNVNTAFADEYSGISHNSKIIDALNLLKNSNGNWALDAIKGNNLSGNKIKVRFTTLALMSSSYRNFNALACKDRNGRLYILIDNKHKDAPAAAIASLLCHEVIHQDDLSSIAEETQGWTNEAIQWIEMKKLNPELANINDEDCRLVKRLNKMEQMYNDADKTSQLIKIAVMRNQGYLELAMSSPGYGI